MTTSEWIWRFVGAAQANVDRPFRGKCQMATGATVEQRAAEPVGAVTDEQLIVLLVDRVGGDE